MTNVLEIIFKEESLLHEIRLIFSSFFISYKILGTKNTTNYFLPKSAITQNLVYNTHEYIYNEVFQGILCSYFFGRKKNIICSGLGEKIVYIPI